jgi:hypothetical protein
MRSFDPTGVDRCVWPTSEREIVAGAGRNSSHHRSRAHGMSSVPSGVFGSVLGLSRKRFSVIGAARCSCCLRLPRLRLVATGAWWACAAAVCLVIRAMTATRQHRVSRAVRAALEAMLASLVVAAVLAGSVHAGRTYVYCRAMQAVMSHACCPSHAREMRATGDVRAWVAPTCCEARSLPSLAAYTPTHRAAEPSAPAAVALALPRYAAIASTPVLSEWSFGDPTMRAGPPKLRVHLLLMVFHV